MIEKSTNFPTYTKEQTVVQAVKQSDGAIHYEATYTTPPLNGYGLHRLLNEVAPNKRAAASVAGIIADWEIADSDPKGNGYIDNNLMNVHKVLGHAWETFMIHRPVFQATLEEVNTPSFGDQFGDDREFFFGKSKPVIIPRDRFSSNYVINWAIHDPQGLSKLTEYLEVNDVTRPDLAIAQAALPYIGSRIDRKRPKAIFNKISTMGKSRREEIITNAIRELNPKINNDKSQDFINNHFMTATFPDGKQYLARRNRIVGDFQESIDQSVRDTTSLSKRFTAKSIDITYLGDPLSYTANTRYKSTKSYILENTIKRTDGNTDIYTVTPILRWTKDTEGNRSFNDLNQEPQILNDGSYTSSLLGVFVAAQAEPTIRETWPKEMGLKDARQGLKQSIGGAQVPVLLAFPHVQKQLLSSEYIAHLETNAQ